MTFLIWTSPHERWYTHFSSFFVVIKMKILNPCLKKQTFTLLLYLDLSMLYISDLHKRFISIIIYTRTVFVTQLFGLWLESSHGLDEMIKYVTLYVRWRSTVKKKSRSSSIFVCVYISVWGDSIDGWYSLIGGVCPSLGERHPRSMDPSPGWS